MIKKNTYVLIKKIILDHEDRTAHLPDDTKRVDYVMKIKGLLTHDANLNDEVTILSDTHRLIKGKLIEVNPSYTHSYGKHLDEVLKMKSIILSEMEDLNHD